MNCSKAFDNLAEEDLWCRSTTAALLTSMARAFKYFTFISRTSKAQLAILLTQLYQFLLCVVLLYVVPSHRWNFCPFIRLNGDAKIRSIKMWNCVVKLKTSGQVTVYVPACIPSFVSCVLARWTDSVWRFPKVEHRFGLLPTFIPNRCNV